MHIYRIRVRRSAGSTATALLAAAGVVALLAVTDAQGAKPVTTTQAVAPETSQPFAQWGDYSDYFLAPNGGFEELGSWEVTGGSGRKSGNERFYVRSPDDAYSMAVGSEEMLTSRPIDLGSEHPTIRFFVRNTGDKSAALKVTIVTSDAKGRPIEKSVATVYGTSEWEPTPPLALPDMTTSLDSGTYASAKIRVTSGKGGSFAIDDVYVDPRKH